MIWQDEGEGTGAEVAGITGVPSLIISGEEPAYTQVPNILQIDIPGRVLMIDQGGLLLLPLLGGPRPTFGPLP